MNEPQLAVVTGAGSGIGRAIAIKLARAGYTCLLVGRRADRLAGTAEIIAGENGTSIEAPSDVTTPEGRAAVRDSVGDSGLRLRALVNNAGGSYAAGIFAVDLDRWRYTFALNVEAAAFLSFEALRLMSESGGGAIVNIGSVYSSVGVNTTYYASSRPPQGENGPIRSVAYAASKGALLQLTRELAIAGAPMGVRVNTLSPGMIEIDDRASLDDATVEALSAQTPMGRFGRPAEIAEATHFLLSEGASFITGTDLLVDGGWTAW